MIPELKNEMNFIISDTKHQFCRNFIENSKKILDVCKSTRGGHLVKKISGYSLIYGSLDFFL